MKLASISAVLSFLFVAAVGWYLWSPGVQRGLPYFYDEDEAHHFTRTVNMVKTGDYNPHYFRKPSLHFYLRMPAVAIGYLYSVSKDRAHSLNDVVSDDPHGIARYPLSTTHPEIAKFARMVSILCGGGLCLWPCF